MPPLSLLVPTALAAYLVGAVPFGYLTARARGVNIFAEGSGNMGATNVGRVLGRPYGLMVFVLDFAKGAIPVALAKAWAEHQAQPGGVTASLTVTAGVAALLGHMFPVYLRFRGGKGVATGAGALTIALPGPTLAAALVWVAAIFATRTVSLASLAAAVTLCATAIAVNGNQPAAGVFQAFACLAAALVVIRHRANLARLLRGEENRIRDSASFCALTKLIHVLALGLWFGSAIFFLIATLALFRSFESLGQADGTRPSWLPIAADFDVEKGTRLAGFAVAPLFDRYFPLQAACGVLALGTAISWWSALGNTRLHRFRVGCLALAGITALAGWPLAGRVNAMRLARYSADPLVAQEARTAFASAHLQSLLLNGVTVIGVTIAMALAANLPGSRPDHVVESSLKNP